MERINILPDYFTKYRSTAPKALYLELGWRNFNPQAYFLHREEQNHETTLQGKAIQTTVESCCNIQALNQIRIGLLMPLFIIAFLFYCLLPTIVLSSEMTDLTELDLEDLMNIEITSVSKKPQRLSDAAAAIFVITSDDIQRSGVTSIPEALRMAPGVQVAKIDANKWAISSRGFSGRFANKLLVLIDGRTVYSPLYSGVYWEVQDTLLEDIDRIEVIRGPGASLWGANAVNGVINIITKHTKDTQDGLAIVSAGTEERGNVAIRYGGKRGDNTRYRVYTKYFKRDDAAYASGDEASDDCSTFKAGFRVDRQISDVNTLMLTGDIYDGRSGQRSALAVPIWSTINNEVKYNGMNLLGRWEHDVSDDSNIMLQLYYDRTERKDILLDEIRDILDFEFNQQFSIGERHRIILGFGYRFTRDNLDNSPSITFVPDRRNDDLYSAFIQDDIWLLKDRLCLRIGSKFEHNDYTGFEIQPNARLILTPGENYSVWISASRAVRTPSRIEHDTNIISPTTLPNGAPIMINVLGNDHFDSEELKAYEMGFRLYATEHISLDLTVFFNDYEELLTYETLSAPFLPPYTATSITVQVDNQMEGHVYGAEVAAKFQVYDWWRLQGTYTYLQMQLHPDEGSMGMTPEIPEGYDPHHKLSLRSSLNLREDLDLDLWVRYVDSLPTQDVKSYVTLDARLSWKPRNDLELSIVGQNLLDNQHMEYNSIQDYSISTEVEHSIYGKITWHF